MSGTGDEYRRVLLFSAAGHLALLAVVLVLGNVSFTRPAPVPLTIQAEVVIDNSAELRRAAEERQRQEQAAAERRRAEEQRRQQEQRAAEERRQQEAERQQRERDAQAQREREAADQRAVAERQRQQEAERKAAEERQRQQEAERKAAEERRQREEAERQAAEQRRAREAQARREAELAAQLAAEEELRAARSSAEMGIYVAQITSRIEREWIRPASAVAGLRCQVRVTQIPGGEVVDVRVGTCNGDDAVRRSIEAAVRRASPLPVPDNPRLFERNLVITFEPRD